jgi:putative transposase
MISQCFSPGKQFMWNEEAFEIDHLLTGDQIQLENIANGGMLTACISDLTNELFQGHLAFISSKNSLKKRRKGNTENEEKYLELSDCPEKLLEKANFRLDAIKPLLDKHTFTRAQVDARAKEILKQSGSGVKRASTASLYRWIRDYKKSGNDIRSLIPKSSDQGGKGSWRADEVVEKIISDVIDECYRKSTAGPGERKLVSDLRNEICRRIEIENKRRFVSDRLPYPADSTIRRRINALDIRERFAVRLGRTEAKKQFEQYGKGPEAEHPGERVEIDHTKLDLIVIDDEDDLPLGRLTLTDCMDIRTRYPQGFYTGFEPPSYLAVMECMYNSILPKIGLREKWGLEHDWIAHGIPSTLVTDNGREFIGKDLPDACRDLDIVLEQMPIKKHYYKGKIERLFRSVTFLVHGLPGTTFSNPRDRGEYDSVGQACLYLRDVENILVRFFVDTYAERLHKGIGAVPARRWEKHLSNGFNPRLPASAEKLLILLGHTDWRTIQHYGVDFECIRFNSPDLGYLRNQLKGQKAKIKIHPGDMSRIYIQDPASLEYLTVPALDPDGYTVSLSLWKHRVIRRRVLDQQDKVDYAALGRARAAIQEIVNGARSRKRIASRAKIKRWENGGKPPSLSSETRIPAAALPAPVLEPIDTQSIPTAEWSAFELNDNVAYEFEYRSN